MATELGKAYVQIMPSADGIKKQLENILEKNAPNGKEPGKNTGKGFADGVTSVLKSSADGIGKVVEGIAKAGLKAAEVAAKATLATVGAAAAGVTAVVKESVSGYSALEQSVGGVETLFKDNADTVIKYANEAYKTAGVNANTYMENVTSFSASLLQGLGGDTEKAADLANAAMVDMSDNANKFGTDISSIQDAYQGFAKQNYTMLDNLKLGYGGTQSEMARLINDSGVLGDGMTVTAETVNQVSFDKIIEAIHTVQDDMGVAGTTSKEAATTISGACGMMKASWQNLVTGMSDPNADMGALIDNFAESTGVAMDNLIPVIQQALGNVTQLISGLAPVISEKLPELVTTLMPSILTAIQSITQAIVTALPELISSLTTAITALFPTMVNTFVSILPQLINGLNMLINGIIEIIPDILPLLLEGAVKLFLALIDGLNQVVEQLVPMLPEIIKTISDVLIENLPEIIECGFELLVGLINGITNCIPQLTDSVLALIPVIVQSLLDNLPELINAGLQLIVALAQGLPQAIPQVIAMIPEIISAMIEAFFEVDWLDVGVQILAGIGEGLLNGVGAIWDTVKDVGSSIVDGFCDFFGIASPSRLFRDVVGTNLALGIGVGFENNIDDVNKQMQDSVLTDYETTAAIMGNTTGFNSIVSTADIESRTVNSNDSKAITMVLTDTAGSVLAELLKSPLDMLNGASVSFAERGLA